jgi:RHS repeat-associated protein
VYTSTVAPQYPLQVDTSINTVYGGVYNVVVTNTGPATTGTIQWLVTDQLGTPRMVFDKSGSFASVKRHDYLPFGEELFAGQGLRTSAQGYGAPDSVRQKFTGYERDTESGLDFAQARYFASMQGRFTSPDPLMASGSPVRPQTWNRYGYALNNPMRLVDPTGLEPGDKDSPKEPEGKKQTPLPLPEGLVEAIYEMLGPAVNTTTTDGEIATIANTGDIAHQVIQQATDFYNEAFEIGADANGQVNNGVPPQTTQVETGVSQKETRGLGAKALSGPEANNKSESGSAQTVTASQTPQSRMSALDANITKTTASLAETISKTPITVYVNGQKQTGNFEKGSISRGLLTIFDAAKMHGAIYARSLKPAQTKIE